jgi:hypothetical protein
MANYKRMFCRVFLFFRQCVIGQTANGKNER